MVLSDKEIRTLIAEGEPLIYPFLESNLQAASYDVAISNSISVGNNNSQVIYLSDDISVKESFYDVTIPSNGYILKPGEFILALLTETLSIPANLCAHVRPRTHFTRMGILVTPQHCNPGYKGRLTIGILNASPNAVVLVPDLKIAQIVFEELTSTPSENKQYHKKADAAFSNETDIRKPSFTKNELSPTAKAFFEQSLKEMMGAT